ncbi:MAG TPA: S53 family peptidase [Baekduia sp.]|uniref:S53 family peptidase n=1 Tax=Baekduia sp. TaxID=2600305 RepID=UPI002D76E782|nr:S53 family peptidase [Baekduia sp.]HET6506253.1 S53 family peptidase [Baekduia sp.]
MHRVLQRALLASTTAATLSAAAVPAHAAPAGRATIDGSAPSWAQPGRDQGAADNGSPVDIKVYLPLRDADTALAMVHDVSDPQSAAYGQYLSPQDFRSRFAPSDADVAQVERFLKGAGLSVGDVPANHTSIAASGSLAQVEQAFGVDVHRYAYRGKVLNAPTAPLTIPSALQGKVLAVSGVDQSGALTRPASVPPRGDDAFYQGTKPNAPAAPATKHTNNGAKAGQGAPPPPAFVNAPPCSEYFGAKIASDLPDAYGSKQPYAPCGYTPAQFQGAYGNDQAIAKGLDGSGITVAITDAYAAPTILQDANAYAQAHGQAPFAQGQFSQVTPKKYLYGYNDKKNGDLCGEQGWYGEETLDVEAVHAMAPGAKVVYVAGRSCDDGDLEGALNTVVDNKLATIVTNSWGSLGEDEPADYLKAYQQTFIQADLEGIGMFFSSGDEGDDSTQTADGTPAADFPSTDPLVTAVGGTSLGVGQDDDYLFETGWATGTSKLSADGTSWDPTPPGDWAYGAGGGVSVLFDQPWYQQGVVPDAVAHGKRATPDIAMDGDPQTGMLVGETQTFPDGSAKYAEYRIGGTSLASPLYAGLEAIADQAWGRAHGFVNPKIYALNGTSAVHDIVPPASPKAVVRVDYNNKVDDSAGTTTSLRTLDDEAQSIHTAPGWDTITGVGTPNGIEYIKNLG